MLNHNGSDPVADVINLTYEGLVSSEKTEFDLICRNIIKRAKEIHKRNSMGMKSATELVGKLAIYLQVKSEECEDDENIWETLFRE